MADTEYSRASTFLSQALAIWGHKISQDFKNHSNIKQLCSEWTKSTKNLTDYQFKNAARRCKEEIEHFPTIADFLKLSPPPLNDSINLKTSEEIFQVKENMKKLIASREEILHARKPDPYKYTLLRSIDETIAKEHRKLILANVPENLIP